MFKRKWIAFWVSGLGLRCSCLCWGKNQCWVVFIFCENYQFQFNKHNFKVIQFFNCLIFIFKNQLGFQFFKIYIFPFGSHEMVFTNVRIVSFQRLHNQISKKLNKNFILKSKFPVKTKNDYNFLHCKGKGVTKKEQEEK